MGTPSFLDPAALDLSRSIRPPSDEILKSSPQFLFHRGRRYRLVGMEEVTDTPAKLQNGFGLLARIAGLWAQTNFRPVYMPYQSPLVPELYTGYFSSRKQVQEDMREIPLLQPGLLPGEPVQEHLETDAGRNDPGALYLLGTLLNKPDSTRYLLQNRAAQNAYGYISYELGVQAESDEHPRPAEAIAHFQRAADLDHVEAIYRLGCKLAADISIENNVKSGFVLIKKAADRGHPHAQYRVAQMYRLGTGVSINNREAVRFYGLAADQSHIDAMFQFWQYFNPKPRDIPWDPRRQNYLKTAAKAGHKEAQFHYAETFLPAFPEGAATWFRKAADQGHQEARYRLGLLHTKNLAVLPLETGLPYIKQAATGGHKEAQYLLQRLTVYLPNGKKCFRRNPDINFAVENYVPDEPKSFLFEEEENIPDHLRPPISFVGSESKDEEA